MSGPAFPRNASIYLGGRGDLVRPDEFARSVEIRGRTVGRVDARIVDRRPDDPPGDRFVVEIFGSGSRSTIRIDVEFSEGGAMVVRDVLLPGYSTRRM